MKKAPTYTAKELLNLSLTIDVDFEGYKILTELINDELDLYEEKDIPTIKRASENLFIKALLKGALKFLK